MDISKVGSLVYFGESDWQQKLMEDWFDPAGVASTERTKYCT